MSGFKNNTKKLATGVLTAFLAYGWHAGVAAQTAAFEQNAELGDLANLVLPADQQELSDDLLAGMRGQGSEALVIAAQRHEIILWDEDSSDKGRGDRSAQQGNQVITVKVNLGGR